MSHLLRCGLVAAGLVGAFAAGFFLKPVPAIRTGAAQPVPVSHTVARPPDPAQVPAVEAPPIRDPQVKQATVLGAPQPARAEAIDPLEAAGMEMIRRELGHKTTILEKNEPVPAVLADARKQPAPIEIPSVPMGGPMPRLDPPPLPMIPTLPDVVPQVVPTPVKGPRLVNTRAVALDFEVTRTGSSKVTAVELWTTRDGGVTWAKTDRMAGGRSPFRTRLGSEGEYGFRLVFESASGMRSPEPKRGDRPDVRVELDTTPPAVGGLTIRPINGARDKVLIEWTMTDAHPNPAAVWIEYSTDGRAWTPAATEPSAPRDTRVGADAWAWAVPPGLPHRVMIRLTVRDRAGNETTAELPGRVSIDLMAPAGKLTGVRPIEAEVGPAPREVEPAAEPARSIPDALRSLLPALLASPSLYPPLAARTDGGPIAWDVSGNDDPICCGAMIVSGHSASPADADPSPRVWVERLTDTTVVEDPPLPPYRQPDPFAEPAVGSQLTTRPVGQGVRRMWISLVSARDAELWEICDRPLLPAWNSPAAEQFRPYRETAGYTGGRSLIHHLADPDWKPTTATPESCRWEYDPAPTNLWGTPGLGLWFRF